MTLFGSFARFSGRFHSNQEFCLSATFAKRILTTAFSVMFSVFWGVAALVCCARSFVVHNSSFLTASTLHAPNAPFYCTEQDMSV